MNNKQGLSTVVTTLIIILLVLVAVGIIWGVVNNLLTKSSETIGSSTKCLDLDIRATKIANNSADGTDDDYKVTLKRSSAGDNEEIYAKVFFTNSAGDSYIGDFTNGLLPLASDTMNFDQTTVANATKVEVTAYYLDKSGAEKLCPITTEFEIGNIFGY